MCFFDYSRGAFRVVEKAHAPYRLFRGYVCSCCRAICCEDLCLLVARWISDAKLQYSDSLLSAYVRLCPSFNF